MISVTTVCHVSFSDFFSEKRHAIMRAGIFGRFYGLYSSNWTSETAFFIPGHSFSAVSTSQVQFSQPRPQFPSYPPPRFNNFHLSRNLEIFPWKCTLHFLISCISIIFPVIFTLPFTNNQCHSKRRLSVKY